MMSEEMNNKLVSASIADTLWQRCFWEAVDNVKEAGATKIEFEDADKIVLEKSKMPMK